MSCCTAVNFAFHHAGYCLSVISLGFDPVRHSEYRRCVALCFPSYCIHYIMFAGSCLVYFSGVGGCDFLLWISRGWLAFDFLRVTL